MIPSPVILRTVRGVLLDIEGTTSSIAYVYEVLFPFAREHLDALSWTRFETPETVLRP